MPDRIGLVRAFYEAFASGDRAFVEDILASDFRFSSPVDVELDREGFFRRCWPGAGQRQTFRFPRLIEAGDEVIVTYELTKADGSAGRNTEVLTFTGDKVRRAEVYFGWDL